MRRGEFEKRLEPGKFRRGATLSYGQWKLYIGWILGSWREPRGGTFLVDESPFIAERVRERETYMSWVAGNFGGGRGAQV